MNNNFFSSYISKPQMKSALELISKNHLSEGKLLYEFQHMLEKKLGKKNITVVNSGSVALYISLLSLNLSKGDEILMTNRSWISTFHAAKLLNIKVKFIDVNIEDENIDYNLIENAISKKTKVIVTVSRNGRIYNRKNINKIVKKYNLKLIDDCAQSFLSGNKADYVNPQADYSCFSFGPTKLLNIGQGGAILSRNKILDKTVKNIKYNGLYNKSKIKWSSIGFNFKFTDLQSAFGIVLLRDIDKKIDRLKYIYKIFSENLNQNENISIIKSRDKEVPLYLEVICNKRHKLIKYLSQHSIGSYPFYDSLSDSPLSINKNYFYKSDFSMLFRKKGLWLLSGASQKDNDIIKMTELINKFFN